MVELNFYGRWTSHASLLPRQTMAEGNPEKFSSPCGKLVLTHSLRTAVSVLPCESTLEWNGSALTGTTRTAGEQLSWRGELLETSGKGD